MTDRSHLRSVAAPAGVGPDVRERVRDDLEMLLQELEERAPALAPSVASVRTQIMACLATLRQMDRAAEAFETTGTDEAGEDPPEE